MLIKKLSVLMLNLLLLTSCASSPSTSDISTTSISSETTSESTETTETTSEETSPSEELEDLEIRSITLLGVYEVGEIDIINKLDNETFKYEIPNDSLRIENNKVIALRGNTKTKVNVTSSLGRTGSFNVTIRNRAYSSTHSVTETNEKWFNEVSINRIDNLTTSFANGMDISSFKQLYDNGQRFYDKNGNETALPLLLKDNGVNFIRLRLWVDPYDTWEENGETKTYLYGGGNCNTTNVLWMAKECVSVGLKVLLNFHYSDFWTDPSHQIIPKRWKDIKSNTELANEVYNYTKETLTLFKENNCLPSIVALGNEIYNGLFAHNPGGITKEMRNGELPYYSYSKTERTDSTNAKYDHTDSKTSTPNANLRMYLSSAIRAVRSVDKSIETMVHFVRGFADTAGTIRFFNVINDLDFDIYSISAYPYSHWSNKTQMRNGISTIASAFPAKKFMVAEVSYGFTYESDVNAKHMFAPEGQLRPISDYPVSVQGQANLIHDITEAVASEANGYGVFYWEGAWTPTKNSGWADASSKASYANQALVSYNGKALGSLEVYKKMLGN